MNREEAMLKYSKTTISGLNCGATNTGFMSTICSEQLLEQNIGLRALIEKHPECLTALQILDKNYDLLNEKEIKSTPLQRGADNKPQLVGVLTHHIRLGGRTPSEVFQCYGDIGIVPSEYFGILESEREACFCVSLARTYERNQQDDPLRISRCALKSNGQFKGYISENYPSDNVYFILDEQIYSEIEKNNYFAIKQYKSDSQAQIDAKQAKIDALSPDEQVLYKTLNTFSHGVSSYEESEWFAFPGGIPSKYINGIVMDSRLMDTDPSLSATLEESFPQATIIDIKDNSIIREQVSQPQQE